MVWCGGLCWRPLWATLCWTGNCHVYTSLSSLLSPLSSLSHFSPAALGAIDATCLPSNSALDLALAGHSLKYWIIIICISGKFNLAWNDVNQTVSSPLPPNCNVCQSEK